MWWASIVLIVLLALCWPCTVARVFNRCDLARTLYFTNNLSYEQVGVWVCIAKYQSNFNTKALNYDSEGTGYHGMYQISDRYWCSTSGRPGNVCNIECERLRNDDLSDDFACIAEIFEEHQRLSGNGYNAWTTFGQYCANDYLSLIEDCFGGGKVQQTQVIRPTVPARSSSVSVQNKIYHRCELARELYFTHAIPMDQIASWVCIAKHESSFNTSAVSRSGDHGLFQISDIYWCSPPGVGWVCGLSCAKLEDSDITDDVKCMKKIFDEHQRISGNGFNAWAVYRPYCQYRSEEYIDGCFDEDDRNSIIPHWPAVTSPSVVRVVPTAGQAVKKGLIYERCELAQELRNRHGMPDDQIGTWVCIAHHESRFNTSAIGRLNADGSADHGLFQISDIYWCSPPGKGWVCGLSCAQLEDNDISDDVECMKIIYEEHQRLSGDGFNAWAVYQPYCRGRSEDYSAGCFSNDDNIASNEIGESAGLLKSTTDTGKVYERCELARELRYIHDISEVHVATWVCIAKHESSYRTAVVGHRNADGSGDHGLFQISDIYWCSLGSDGDGKACGLSCDALEDSDITNDVKCMLQIHAEHTRLSGDGFNAWAVYEPYCRGRSDHFVADCFDEDNSIVKHRPAITSPPRVVQKLHSIESGNTGFKSNDLGGLTRQKDVKESSTVRSTSTTSRTSSTIQRPTTMGISKTASLRSTTSRSTTTTAKPTISTTSITHRSATSTKKTTLTTSKSTTTFRPISTTFRTTLTGKPVSTTKRPVPINSSSTSATTKVTAAKHHLTTTKPVTSLKYADKIPTIAKSTSKPTRLAFTTPKPTLSTPKATLTTRKSTSLSTKKEVSTLKTTRIPKPGSSALPTLVGSSEKSKQSPTRTPTTSRPSTTPSMPTSSRPAVLISTEDPFAIYFNQYQTKKLNTFYKFNTFTRSYSPTVTTSLPITTSETTGAPIITDRYKTSNYQQSTSNIQVDRSTAQPSLPTIRSPQNQRLTSKPNTMQATSTQKFALSNGINRHNAATILQSLSAQGQLELAKHTTKSPYDMIFDRILH